MLVCFSVWMLNLDVFEFGTCSVLMRSNWKSVVVFDVSLFSIWLSLWIFQLWHAYIDLVWKVPIAVVMLDCVTLDVFNLDVPCARFSNLKDSLQTLHCGFVKLGLDSMSMTNF